MTAAAAVARACFEAFANRDMPRFESLLSPDLVAWVTNADGGADEVRGRAAYMRRMPDLESADWKVRVTQVLGIDEERAMVAVEVLASRNGKELHNFAGFLARVRGEAIAELWMVEAQPAYSDVFWA